MTQYITIELDASGHAVITPGDIDNGSSDACGIASLSLSTSNFDCSSVGSNTLVLTVTDVNGNASTASAVVEVLDVTAPMVATQDITVYLDANGQASISASDIDNGSWDACGIASLMLDMTDFDCSSVGVHTVTLTATDVNGNPASAQANVTVVDNEPPVVMTQDLTLHLDASGQIFISAQDIDAGSYDNCGVSSVTLDVTGFSCSEVGVNTVILTVTDVNGNVAQGPATVTVLNDLPEINSLEGPSGPVNISVAVNVSATFTDVNLVSAIWTWSNGVTTAGAINGNLVSGSYIFDAPGIYDVSLTIVDICGESATLGLEDIVVYDPDAGFTLGAGWIESPAGAYIPDPGYEGSGHYVFSARYWRNSEVPYGHVHFKLHKTRMRFRSRDFDWLVIHDDKAILRGEGKINGKGKYDFELQGYDAGKWGHYSGDMLRMRIWEQETGDLVYDNGLGAPDDELTTQIGRGFVYINDFHKPWWKKSEEEGIDPVEISDDILVYPNPFSDYLMIEMEGEDNSEVIVELYNEAGQKFMSRKAYLTEGKVYLETTDAVESGIYILRIITEGQDVKQSILYRE
jgi:hypothetical protein